MKVLSISTDIKIFDEMSGVKIRQMEYANKMEELHIVVFTLKSQNLSYNHSKNDNLYIYPTDSDSRFDYISDAKKKATEIIKTYNLTKENSVVTTQDPFETGLVGRYIKNKLGILFQTQIHTDFLDPYFKNSILNRIRVILANFVIPCADGVRAVSSAIENSLKLKYPKLKAKVDVLPIWVDMGYLLNSNIISQQDYKKDFMFPVTVLMASRFSKEKRFDVALQAFSNIYKKNNGVGLYITGDGEEKQKILKNIESLNLELNKNIKLIGEWQGQAILKNLYMNSDIFLLTSDFEGYGMTLVEAAASGCPIVTTCVGLAKTDLFKDGVNSYVCPVGDVKCLSEKLSDLISNPGKAREFASRMKTDIQKLSISKEDYVTKYVGLLESLLNK